MKRKKNITLIAGVAVLAVLVIGYAVLKNQSPKAEEEDTSISVVKINSDEVIGLGIQEKENGLSFSKEQESWYYEGDKEFPVDQDKISALLENFQDLTATRVLDRPENLEEFGLVNPVKTVTLTEKDDSETKIHIGGTNETTNTAYVYLNEDTSKIYMVPSTLPESFQVKLYDLALGDTFPVMTASTITRYTLSKGDTAFTIEKDAASNTGWSVTDWDGTVKPAGSSEVNTRLSAVAGFSYAAFVDYNPQDLSLYGLEQPQAVLTADYEVKEEINGEINTNNTEPVSGNTSVSENDENTSEERVVAKQLILSIGNMDESGNYYVKTDSSQGVYTIAGESIQQLLEDSAASYLSMNVKNDSFADLNQLSITMGTDTYILESKTVEGELDKAKTESDGEDEKQEDTVTKEGEDASETKLKYYLNGNEINSGDFQEFYSKLTATTAQSRLDALPENLQDAEFSFTFHRKRGEDLIVSYHPYDASFYFAQDNFGNLFLVNKMNVKEMINELDKLISE